MRGMRILVPLAALAMLAVACGSEGTAATAMPTDSLTATIAPSPWNEPRSLLSPADYANGGEIAHLVDGLGPERAFPSELLSTSEPLSQDEGAAAWKGFLDGGRVFQVASGKVREVRDFCGRVATYRYSPDHIEGGNWFIGEHVPWSVEFAGFDQWNKPRLVRTDNLEERQRLLSRGWGAITGFTLFPPAGDDLPSLEGGGFGRVDLRVFEIPDCIEIQPLRQFTTGQWEVLDLGEWKNIADFIDPEAPQLDEEAVLDGWEKALGDNLVYMNIQGIPSLFVCADGTGIVVARYGSKELYGRSFTWRLEDARDVAKNAVFVITEMDLYASGSIIDQNYFLDVESQLDPYYGFIAVASPDCSIDQGMEYLETVEAPDLGRQLQSP